MQGRCGRGLVASSGASLGKWARRMLGGGVLVALLVSGAAYAATPLSAEARGQLDEAVRLIEGREGRDQDRLAARAIVDALLERTPDAPAVLRERARLELMGAYGRIPERAARRESAAAFLDRAIAGDPAFADAYSLLGFIRAEELRLDDARAALTRAEALGTRDPWLHLNWSDVLMAESNYEDAIARCERAAATHRDDVYVGGPIRSCLVSANWKLQRFDRVDALYRDWLVRHPDDADARAQHAHAQLCVLDDPVAAMATAQVSLAGEPGDLALRTLVAAHYVHWADAISAGDAAQADARWAAAERLPFDADDAIGVLDTTCGRRDALQLANAMRDNQRASPLAPMVAVLAAAQQADDDGGDVPGVFAMTVTGTGRDAGFVYLNSEADYRDQRNLTLRVSRKAADAFAARTGQQIDVALKGQDISIVGVARRTRIVFRSGAPESGYYYQTHVRVDDEAQIRRVSEQEPPIRAPKPGTRV